LRIPLPPPPFERQALTEESLSLVTGLLAVARKPVIYAGGGIIASGTGAELARLAEILDSPVVLTLMGLGAMDARHPLCLGALGMHGSYCANVAVNEADLVLALGVRFDDRVIGDPDGFAAVAKIVHIDIDPTEIGKNKGVHLGIPADLRVALAQLLKIAVPLASADWRAYLAASARARPLVPSAGNDERLTGPQAIALLAEQLPTGSVITTGVGQHQMWAMQFMAPKNPRGFLSSAGFGTMGFGLPAAIGAKTAQPERFVVDIDGDGSLNMTINELSTCHRHRLGVKIFVINNQCLGMVRQWQDLIYEGNRVVSSLHDPLVGEPPAPEETPYPDFLAIAAGYRIEAMRVRTLVELKAGIARLLLDPQEPFLLDVMVERETDVFPMIPAGETYRDTVFSRNGAAIAET
jgi:acetolactate synthase-1/2/3 large subunit